MCKKRLTFIKGNKITNDLEKEMSSGIVSLLLSRISYHHNRIVAGSAFSIFSSLFHSSSLAGAFLSQFSSPPSSSLSAVFWADQLSPSHFYTIWRNYGFTFVGKGAETNLNNNSTTTSTTSESDNNEKEEGKESTSTQLTYPNFNFILVVQLLQMCTETRYVKKYIYIYI